MTPETHAALGRVIAFLDAFEDEAHPQGAISTLRTEGLRLTAPDLRTLLDVIDPTPTTEWGVHFRFDQVDNIVPYASEKHARDFAGSGGHTLVHRFAVRRPDDVSDWIEGEPAAPDATRHAPPADEPIGHIPTQAGLDYLKMRREQNPRPRISGGPS